MIESTAHQYSIVIPVFNQLEYTKICLASILSDPDRSAYEIVVVDNGSTDGTKEYLLQLQKELSTTKDKLEPLFNVENRGVAPAWNQGVEASTGRYIAVLNNDIKVSKGWFRGMLWAMETFKLGLISPFAQHGQLNYDFDQRSQLFTQKNFDRTWNDYDFCAFLFTRGVYSSVGKFDEKFLVGGYEDTDYCYRLTKDGIPFGVTGASFIHHFGSQTLGEFKKRGDKHAQHNLDYFISKWGVDPRLSQNTWRAKIKRFLRRQRLKLDWM